MKGHMRLSHAKDYPDDRERVGLPTNSGNSEPKEALEGLAEKIPAP